mmetsp:Transcript_4271/g.14145  ORF Transcript_4271/g.14145 Transcript_4271/m.14145 type:complete len:289 (-) Transcript_4271:169-1035(-)
MPVRPKPEPPSDPIPRRRDPAGEGPPRPRSPELDHYLDGRAPKRPPPRFQPGPPGPDVGRYPPVADLPPVPEEKVGLVVEHLFDGSSTLEQYAVKVRGDTTETCVAFGEVAKLEVAVPKLPSVQPVYVEFYSASAANAAAENLSSRTYDGRQLIVRRLTRRDLQAEVDAFHRSKTSKFDVGATRHLEEQVDDLRRQLTRAQGDLREADDKRDTEKARLRTDLAHHATQHKLLQARVDELEDELDKTRTSARKDREYHAARTKALADRADALERDRDRDRDQYRDRPRF